MDSGTSIIDESVELVVIPLLQDLTGAAKSDDDTDIAKLKREEMCAVFSLPEIFQVKYFFIYNICSCIVNILK